MSAKNLRQGIPRPFTGLTVAKFPEDKPIFWGKNQDTQVNQDYVEPEKPKEGLLKLPISIRFLTTKSTPIFLTRFFEFAKFTQGRTEFPWPYDPTSYETIVAIEDVYDANQTSQEVVDMWAPMFGNWYIGPKTWYFGLTNIISGNIATQTNTFSTWFRGPGGEFDRVLINFFPITGLILQP